MKGIRPTNMLKIFACAKNTKTPERCQRQLYRLSGVEPFGGGHVRRTSPSPHGTAEQQDNGGYKIIAFFKTSGPNSNTSSCPLNPSLRE